MYEPCAQQSPLSHVLYLNATLQKINALLEYSYKLRARLLQYIIFELKLTNSFHTIKLKKTRLRFGLTPCNPKFRNLGVRQEHLLHTHRDRNEETEPYLRGSADTRLPAMGIPRPFKRK